MELDYRQMNCLWQPEGVSPLRQSSSHQTQWSHFKLKLTAQTSRLELSFYKSWQMTENGTRSPSCWSHYLQSNAIMRSTRRCLPSFEPYKSGGTSSKAPNTSLRYGQTTKTSSTLWQKNSSIEDKPSGCSTSTMGLAAMTTPMSSSSLRSSSQYALSKVWNLLGLRGMFWGTFVKGASGWTRLAIKSLWQRWCASFKSHPCVLSIQLNGQNMMAFFTIVVASTSLQPLIFDDALSHFVMTLRSPDTPDASKPSNSFLETTGGPTCHTMLASTPRSAFIPRYSIASWLENCKGNFSLKKCLKHCARSRASKSTSRRSEDVQLHNNELRYITYLAEDLKRKEWGSSCWYSLIYEPIYKVPSNVNWMSIYVKYMSSTNERWMG